MRAVMALILREISTTYGRSPGGYVWAVLEPAAGIALLTAIFSIGFRHLPLGTNFAFFYAGGMLPFLMFVDISGKIGQTIQFSRTLLNYPRVTFVDAILARLILNTPTQLTVHVVVLGLILLVYAPDTTLDLSYPIWQTIWAVLNRPLFLISCIFFLFETVPMPYPEYLWYNPLVHVVTVMRDGYYPFYHPTFVSIAYPMALGAGLTVIGLFMLNRYHRDILDK